MQNKLRVNIYNFVIFFGTILMLNGCANRHPALNSQMEAIDVSKESVALLSLRVANNYRPSFQPHVILAHIWSTDKSRVMKYRVDIDDAYNKVEIVSMNIW